MIRFLKYSIIVIFILLLTFGCSTKKNTGLTRFYHGLTTKYNILFNGTESYKEGLKKYEQSYVDDYSQILPVFIYGDEELASGSKSSMDRTIEKSTKSIKLHSITKKPEQDKNATSKKDKDFYNKNEYNAYIDDSYLIMAKAFFYQADYESAIRLFDFITKQYDDKETIYLAYNWLVRSNVQLKDFREARNLLSNLENDFEYPEKLNFELNLTFADFYLKQQQFNEAEPYVAEALNLAKRKKSKLRLSFILAQIKEKQNKPREANELYEQVIKKNPPYEMAFNAKLKRAALVTGGKSVNSVRSDLLSMLKDEKNDDYQDQIYFALGELERKNNNLNKAIEYYQESAISKGSNKNQKGITYLTLANIFFGQARYMESQAYFDSAVVTLNSDYPGYLDLSIKNQYLSKLVKNLREVKHQDSIQKVAKMPESEREAFIQKIIQDLKSKEAAEVERQRQEEMSGIDNNLTSTRPINNMNEEGKWYFYNPSAKSFGEPEFRRRWGKRKLEDNWRRKNKQAIGIEQITEENFSDDILDSKVGLDNKTPEYYKVELPLTDSAMEVSHMKIQRALYNVGEVYRNDLKDFPLSLESYKELIDRYPDGEYKVPSYYAIYKVFLQQNETSQADIYKNMIIRNYPESKYAKVLLDPNYSKQFEQEEIDRRNHYISTMDSYRQEKFQEVIRQSDFAINKYPDSEYLPKYRYLKAVSMGEIYGVTVMKPELEKISKEFKNDPVGKSSEDLLASIKENELRNLKDINIVQKSDSLKIDTEEEKLIAQKTLDEIEKIYQYNAELKHSFVIVISKKADMNQLKFNVINFNLDFYIQQTFDIESKEFNEYSSILTVKEFKNAEESLEYYNKVLAEKDRIFADTKSEDYQFFVISQDNLLNLSKEKMVRDYLLFYQSNYRE